MYANKCRNFPILYKGDVFRGNSKTRAKNTMVYSQLTTQTQGQCYVIPDANKVMFILNIFGWSTLFSNSTKISTSAVGSMLCCHRLKQPRVYNLFTNNPRASGGLGGPQTPGLLLTHRAFGPRYRRRGKSP